MVRLRPLRTRHGESYLRKFLRTYDHARSDATRTRWHYTGTALFLLSVCVFAFVSYHRRHFRYVLAPNASIARKYWPNQVFTGTGVSGFHDMSLAPWEHATVVARECSDGVMHTEEPQCFSTSWSLFKVRGRFMNATRSVRRNDGLDSIVRQAGDLPCQQMVWKHERSTEQNDLCITGQMCETHSRTLPALIDRTFDELRSSLLNCNAKQISCSHFQGHSMFQHRSETLSTCTPSSLILM